jgi:hypothetical protein
MSWKNCRIDESSEHPPRHYGLLSRYREALVYRMNIGCAVPNRTKTLD